MDQGLKSARMSSLTVVLGLLIGALIVGALQHFGVFPEDPGIKGGAVAQAASAPLMGTPQMVEQKATVEETEDTCTVLFVFSYEIEGFKKVSLRCEGGGRNRYFSALVPEGLSLKADDQVVRVKVSFVDNDLGHITQFLTVSKK